MIELSKKIKRKVLMVSAGLFMAGMFMPVVQQGATMHVEAATKKPVLLVYPSLYELKPKKGSIQNLKRYEVNPKTGKVSPYKPKNETVSIDFVSGTVGEWYMISTYFLSSKNGEITEKGMLVKKTDIVLKKTQYEREKIYKAKQKVTLKKGHIVVYKKIKEGLVISDSIELKADTKVTIVSQGKSATVVKIKPDKKIKKYAGKEIYVLYSAIK